MRDLPEVVGNVPAGLEAEGKASASENLAFYDEKMGGKHYCSTGRIKDSNSAESLSFNSNNKGRHREERERTRTRKLYFTRIVV